MEVHHHPEVEKKGFKEYLLEGLMIFLAVTMGFFAESIRENITDRHKEHEYMTSLRRDLQNDISEAKFIKQDKLRGLSLIDSTLRSFENGDFKTKTSDLYYWARYLGIRNYFKANDGTIQQLNNAGGLRLIHKRNVLDSLQHYINNVKDELSLQGIEEAQLISYKESSGEVFDAQATNKMYMKSDTGVARLTFQKLDHNPPLISYDSRDINKMLMKLVVLKGIRLAELINMNRTIRKADLLIQLVKKEYNLDDE